MRRYIVMVATLSFFAASPAWAQEELLTQCAQVQVTDNSAVADAPGDVRDQFRFLCAQVVNAVTNVQPSIGMAFNGGNPVLGTGSTIGKRILGLPRVSVTARANFAFADVPNLQQFANEVTQNQQTLEAMETFGLPAVALQGDVAIGVFNGIKLAPMIGGFGAVDLLGSVAFIPKVKEIEDKLGLDEAIINAGGGVRIGIIKQGILVPGVSVSGVYRRMGEVQFGEVDAPRSDPGEFASNLSTLSLRVVASKGILFLDFAAGAGYDKYSSDLSFDWQLRCETNSCTSANAGQPIVLRPSKTAGGTPAPIEGELETAAWNVFGDVALNFLMLNIVGELGYQKSTD
ncbi:MAG: hypothetical protein HY561_01065, partial [Gemmatimonadetes bacterium]|nr:hypothetical protein [Gemmatimonadota bacterium]